MKKPESGIEEEIKVPEGITTTAKDGILTVKGPKGEISRDFNSEKASIAVGQGRIIVTAKRSTKKEKQVAGAFEAHINNMFEGVSKGHHYTLKICSGHFPMNVSISGKEFIVKNFLGEKTSRKVTLPAGVSVKINGNDIDVEGPDKELVGTAASAMERLTKRPNFDKRIFQDGIILTSKGQE